MVATNRIKDAKVPIMSSGLSACQGCQKVITVQKPFPTATSTAATRSSYYTLTSVGGPIKKDILEGSKYLLLIVDEASGCVKVFCLSDKP